jgi:putative hydrolase of the HAD superfamily
VTVPRAVVFDLGGTLVQWSDWEGGAPTKWGLAYDALRAANGDVAASRDDFVTAMRAAEKAHWERVDREHWSGSPTDVVGDGFRRLGAAVEDRALLAALDGYARAVAG